MSRRSVCFFCFFFLGLLCSSILLAGCSFTTGVPQWSGSGFIRKELLEYTKVAVLPFEGDMRGEASGIFAETFHQKFPQIELATREQVLEVFQEQELYSARVDEVIRKRLAKSSPSRP